MEVNPHDAALLAKRIYTVQNPGLVDAFLRQPYFLQSSDPDVRSPGSVHLNAEVGGRIVLNYKDGFGIGAIGGPSYNNDLFLIFRGTTQANKKADFLTDARIGVSFNKTGLPVHSGFEHCFSTMLLEIKKFLNAAENKIQVNCVHCIGHSLGGAIASLAADWVAKNKGYTAKLYTFGAPRVGGLLFSKITTNRVRPENFHRVYHRTDPVPMVPLFPFVHAPFFKQAHYLYSAEPLISGEAHKMDKYVANLKDKSWEQLTEIPDQPYSVETAIENWLRSKSNVNTSDPIFWRWLESALIFVLKKIGHGILVGVQSAFVSFLTFADKLAYILRAGIDLAENISIWVELLIRKMMSAMGMKIAKTKAELTQALIRYVLIRLAEKAQKEARNAIRKLGL